MEAAARSSREYGMMCRTYVVSGRREGLPSREMIRRAIRETPSTDEKSGSPETRHEASKRVSLFATGSILAAIAASLCCIPPILFALTGVSILGASAIFAEWRPYLLGVTFGLLALGFYFAYRPAKEACAPGSACAMPRTKRSGRLMLWVASVAVVLFAAFPYYSGPVAELLLSHSSGRATSHRAERMVEHVTFAIEGMDCAACANAVASKLQSLPGVRRAIVSFEDKRAEVEYDPRSATQSDMEKAIQDAGYRVRKG